MTKSSGEATAPSSSRWMPGVSMIRRAVSPLRPLVISVSLPARITMTVCGSPTSLIAFRKPSAIDSTPRNTSTTPAMPMIATTEEPIRCEIDRRLTPVTAKICESIALVPPQRVDDAKAAGLDGRQRAGDDAEQQHQRGPDHEIAHREKERRQEPAGRIADERDERPRRGEARARRRRPR